MTDKTDMIGQQDYFTPKVEDIRLGDYYEVYINESWEKLELIKETGHIVIDFDFWRKGIENKEIRVPYLTKEQIEAEGWKFKNTIMGDLWLEKGYFNLRYRNKMLYITRVLNGQKKISRIIYDGHCKDINTFRKICKLLEI